MFQKMKRLIIEETVDTILMVKYFGTKRANKQMKELGKICILTPIFLLPGGTILVVVLVKYSKKVGIDLTFKKTFPFKGRK